MRTEVITTNIKLLNEKISRLPTDSILLVSEPTVWQLYGEALALKKFESKETLLFMTLPGEAAKSMSEYQCALDFFLSEKYIENLI